MTIRTWNGRKKKYSSGRARGINQQPTDLIGPGGRVGHGEAARGSPLAGRIVHFELATIIILALLPKCPIIVYATHSRPASARPED